VLGGIADDRCFVVGSLRLAEAAARAYVYRFDWRPPGPLGACHCVELPFVFGTRHAWREAPMLAGADPLPDPLVSAVQDAWAAFVRTGDPGEDGTLPEWRAYRPDRHTVMHLDDPPRTTSSG
jgi:para-nitrobenzyl esterase